MNLCQIILNGIPTSISGAPVDCFSFHEKRDYRTVCYQIVHEERVLFLLCKGGARGEGVLIASCYESLLLNV
jgi:hypothetical protein